MQKLKLIEMKYYYIFLVFKIAGLQGAFRLPKPIILPPVTLTSQRARSEDQVKTSFTLDN
jgi:hypothetical protein